MWCSSSSSRPPKRSTPPRPATSASAPARTARWSAAPSSRAPPTRTPPAPGTGCTTYCRPPGRLPPSLSLVLCPSRRERLRLRLLFPLPPSCTARLAPHADARRGGSPSASAQPPAPHLRPPPAPGQRRTRRPPAPGTLAAHIGRRARVRGGAGCRGGAPPAPPNARERARRAALPSPPPCHPPPPPPPSLPRLRDVWALTARVLRVAWVRRRRWRSACCSRSGGATRRTG